MTHEYDDKLLEFSFQDTEEESTFLIGKEKVTAFEALKELARRMGKHEIGIDFTKPIDDSGNDDDLI